MTVYVYYLTLPDNFSKTLDIWQRECFMYIQSIFKNLMCQRYDGYIMYLYAWTTKKKLAKRFEYLHNMDLFKGYDIEMTKDEFEKFKIRNEHARFKKQLVESCYPDDDGYMYITALEAEGLHETCEIFAIDRLFEEAVVPADIFKEKTHAALDRLRFTYYYGLQTAEDPTLIYGQDEYGVTTDGYGRILEFYSDTYICYLDMFRPLLRKGLIRREDLEILPEEE